MLYHVLEIARARLIHIESLLEITSTRSLFQLKPIMSKLKTAAIFSESGVRPTFEESL